MSFKFNPFTGKLDLVNSSEDNFSYIYIIEANQVTIPENQQMIVYDSITVDGELIIDGDLVIFDNRNHAIIYSTTTTETLNIDSYALIRQTSSGIVTTFIAETGSQITITNRSGGDNILNITIQGTASPTIKNNESFSLIYNGTDYDFA